MTNSHSTTKLFPQCAMDDCPADKDDGRDKHDLIGQQQVPPGYLKRADKEKLRQIFNKYASIEQNWEKYMTPNDVIRKFLGLFSHNNYNASSVELLAGIINTSKSGLISFPEFQYFEGVLCRPDALYRVVFQLFDANSRGLVRYEDFRNVIQKTILRSYVNEEFVKSYFGRGNNGALSYPEFFQFLHDFHEENTAEAFRRMDTTKSGFISPKEFQEIMYQVKPHLLTPQVAETITALANNQNISFPYFLAFNRLLNNMDLVKNIYLTATSNSLTTQLTKDEFLKASQGMMMLITPLEIDILFDLCTLLRPGNGVQYAHLEMIAPDVHVNAKPARTANENKSGVFMEGLYNFVLGATAGTIGVFTVYPFDILKTRLQNQRKLISTAAGIKEEVMYKSFVDCFFKILKNEGIRGLYRGVLVQVIGSAPEKATKLAVNDMIRNQLTDPRTHFIPVWGEMFAGACAGCAQVVFTCPLEKIKIQLQVVGENKSYITKTTVLNLVRELGIVGLYKDYKACWLRDIPFTALYFTGYNHAKRMLQDEKGRNSSFSLLIAGIMAGAPVSAFLTPSDLIKTRLQVIRRPGDNSPTYSGIIDAAKRIWKEEGFRAFWKGAGLRAMRIGPLFGVTQVTYEFLHDLLGVDFGGVKQIPASTGLSHPDHIGGYEIAVPILTGIENKFGLVLPKFK